MDYLISGRKKNFISEFVTGYVLTMILLLYAVVMVFVQGRLLADETTYVLYYNKGDIKLIDIDAEYWMLVVAIFITVTFFYMIYFIIAQLVNRSGVHILCAIAATFLWYTFLSSYRTFDCVLALEISWPTVYAHDISLWLYFGMAIVQLALTALGVFATYKWCMKRNIRIKYQ